MVGTAVAALLGVGAVGAGAHIGGPGTGKPLATNAPDLRTVSVVPYDLGDGQAERLRYCFDAGIASAGPPASFTVTTYDASRAFKAGAAAVAADDARCVDADFAAGSDLAQGTVASVEPGAVTDAANRPSATASEPLTGSVAQARAGATTAPDLIGAEVDAAAGTVTYVYDEPVNPAPVVRRITPADPTTDPPTPATNEVVPNPYVGSSFAYSTAEGVKTPGPATAASVTVAGTRVTVAFGAAPGLDGAIRLSSEYGAVQDRPQTTAAGGRETWTPSSPGVVRRGSTQRPEVVSAGADGPQAYALRFSTAIAKSGETNGRILAVPDDGQPAVAATDSRVDGSTLTVTFPAAVAADPGSVVRILALDGAVTDTNGVASLLSDAASATPNSVAGFTAGPDLVATTTDTASKRVVYSYDERVDPDTATAADFRALGADGTATSGSGGIVADGATVTVNYNTLAGVAVGYANPAGALADPTGRPNAAQSVSSENEPVPAQGTTPTVPGAVPAKPVAKPLPKRLKYRTGFRSFKVRSRTRYSGRLSSAGKGCKSGRRISLKRSGKTVRSGYTKGDGTFTIARSSGLRGKGGVYVVVTERSSAARTCTARGSKKLKRG